MRFVDFIILLCALITAGSTFAVAVELIFDWTVVWPEVMETLKGWGLDKLLPPPEPSVSAPA